MSDTIAAIATPFGEGAIALLRLSGEDALAIASTLWQGRRKVVELLPRHAAFGTLSHGAQKLDDVVLTAFRAPHSYTGEDVVEITCHGGVLVTQRILAALLASGARSAGPGEFTQRAYLNGKMDLTQAEAVMDLISAQTELALRAAHEQLDGRLGEHFRALREQLIEVLAHVEAYIDFPDEDIDPATGAALLAKIDATHAAATALLATAEQGKILREGVRTVIFGAPNVGKSSLLNLLLGTERAIVSARPGTTRDVIEEVINLRGLPLRIADTAGVRESDDELELAGIARTQRELGRADLVLHVFDASVPRPEESAAEHQALAAPELRVLNKADLGEHPSWNGVPGVRISCLPGSAPEPLAEAIAAHLNGGGAAKRDWSIAINARHQAALQNMVRDLSAARTAFTDGLAAEFVAEDLRAALEAIGDVLGRVEHDEVLGKIFASFCIGK